MKLSDDFLYFLEIHTLYKEEKNLNFSILSPIRMFK